MKNTHLFKSMKLLSLKESKIVLVKIGLHDHLRCRLASIVVIV